MIGMIRSNTSLTSDVEKGAVWWYGSLCGKGAECLSEASLAPMTVGEKSTKPLLRAA